MKIEMPWKIEARRLRAEGKTLNQIAAATHRKPSEIKLMLNENGELDALRERRRPQDRARYRLKAVDGKARRATDTPSVRVVKAPGGKKSKVDGLALARMLVAGTIDRATFSQRLRGEP
jgi:hypothetical protein